MHCRILFILPIDEKVQNCIDGLFGGLFQLHAQIDCHHGLAALLGATDPQQLGTGADILPRSVQGMCSDPFAGCRDNAAILGLHCNNLVSIIMRVSAINVQRSATIP